MALVEFENKPSTNTPVNATNLNNNFNELDGKIDDTYDELKAYSLYSNASGSSGTITLSDSAENYSYIEVYGGAAGVFSSQKIKDPNGKDFNINLNYISGDKLAVVTLLTSYSVSGTTITPNTTSCGYFIITTAGASQFHNDNTNYFSITSVIGYK